MSIRVRPLLAAACCLGAFALSACSSGRDEASSPEARGRASDALRTPPLTRGGGSVTRNNRCLRTTKPCINLIEASSSGAQRVTGVRWELLASNYRPVTAGVQVWIQEVGSGSTLEYQQGISTDASGAFDVEATTTREAASGVYAANLQVDHPLRCGTTYRAITSDPVNGVVYGDPMTTAACPVVH